MLIVRSKESFRILSKILREAKIAAIACDTIYGIVGRAPETFDQIACLKGRDPEKPFLQLISDSHLLEDWGVILPPKRFLSLWPGPFSFILPFLEGGTAAWRVPQDPYLQEILRVLGVPLYSTSVNRADQIPLKNPRTIEAEFGAGLALVEDAGILEDRLVSTLIDLSKKPFQIIRQGMGQVPHSFFL